MCHSVVLEGIEVSNFVEIEDSAAGIVYNVHVERADGDKEIRDEHAANKSFVAPQNTSDQSRPIESVNSLESTTEETGQNVVYDPNIVGVSYESRDAIRGDSEPDGINEATEYVADSEGKERTKCGNERRLK